MDTEGSRFLCVFSSARGLGRFSVTPRGSVDRTAVSAAVPLAGRSAFFDGVVSNVIAGLVLSAIQWAWARCCGREERTHGAQRLRDEEEEAAIRERASKGPPAKGPTAYEVECHAEASTWANASASLGWGPCGALLAALVRLVCFHWLQPAVYLAGLASFWAELGFWQRAFACVVAAREAAYLVLMAAVCVVRPAFLLIDVPGGWASKGAHRRDTVVYVAAPELLATLTVFQGMSNMQTLVGFPLWASDVAGVLAIGAALHSGVTPPPLMVGYLVTVVAGVSFFVVQPRRDLNSGLSREPRRDLNPQPSWRSAARPYPPRRSLGTASMATLGRRRRRFPRRPRRSTRLRLGRDRHGKAVVRRVERAQRTERRRFLVPPLVEGYEARGASALVLPPGPVRGM